MADLNVPIKTEKVTVKDGIPSSEVDRDTGYEDHLTISDSKTASIVNLSPALEVSRQDTVLITSTQISASKTSRTTLFDSHSALLDYLRIHGTDKLTSKDGPHLAQHSVSLTDYASIRDSASASIAYFDIHATDRASIIDSENVFSGVFRIARSETLTASESPTVSIKLWADFITDPTSEKVFLIEIRLAEEATGWTLTAGRTYTYEIPYLNETITLADSTTEIIRKEVSALELDGIALTEVTSIATVESMAGSWWHDTANSKLYIHPPDGGSPVHHTCMAYFWLYLSTKGIILDNRYYEPYVAENGIPGVSQRMQEVLWGVSQISIGSINLLNNRGFFDQMADKFFWTNKKIRILLGGVDLPYNQYTPVFTGQINKKTFTKDDFSLDIRSVTFDLLRQIPINHYWKSDFPNLDSTAEGKIISYAWGKFEASHGIIATCINSVHADGYQFQICDPAVHPIKAITQVYCDLGDGGGWIPVSHYNEDLTNSRFTLSTADIPSFVLGTSRVKVAFEGYQSGGTLIDGAPEVAEDILTTICGYDGDDFNAATFTASRTASNCLLNVYLDSEVSALSVIEKTCISDFAFFDEDAEGRLRYRTMEPTDEETLATLTSEDILESLNPVVEDNPEQIYSKIRVGYSQSFDDQKFYYREAEYLKAKYRYEKSEILILDTYLRNSIDADTLAGRMLWLLRGLSPTLSIALKASQIAKLPGGRLAITLARAPFSTAGGYSAKTFEIVGREFSCFPLNEVLTMRDLGTFGSQIGTWMGESAPNWTTATPAERLLSGFWTDADGYADPPNTNSLNKSLWW